MMSWYLLFCVLQVKMVLEKLYENKKIASATHNIYAYRSVMSDMYICFYMKFMSWLYNANLANICRLV